MKYFAVGALIVVGGIGAILLLKRKKSPDQAALESFRNAVMEAINDSIKNAVSTQEGLLEFPPMSIPYPYTISLALMNQDFLDDIYREMEKKYPKLLPRGNEDTVSVWNLQIDGNQFMTNIQPRFEFTARNRGMSYRQA